ncbi:MAG TPA: DUF2892 domain-containing protein [Bacteroidota bacterium]|nr:DUF2892 domain-containing protein [Bacteroidota bacterium]
MKKNLGSIDRIVRVILALAVAVLYFADQISGMAAIILGVVAVVFVFTSTASFCPIYALLGLSSKKEAAKQPSH